MYTINFKPDRWPAGDPLRATDGSNPSFVNWREDTYIGYRDIDASPTKAWLVGNSTNPIVAEAWRLGIEKRPGEELYDLKNDPEELKNLIHDAAQTERITQLRTAMKAELKRTQAGFTSFVK